MIILTITDVQFVGGTSLIVLYSISTGGFGSMPASLDASPVAILSGLQNIADSLNKQGTILVQLQKQLIGKTTS